MPKCHIGDNSLSLDLTGKENDGIILTYFCIGMRYHMEALTFRAEPEFVSALKDYADRLGISVNTALREIVALVIAFSKIDEDMWK